MMTSQAQGRTSRSKRRSFLAIAVLGVFAGLFLLRGVETGEQRGRQPEAFGNSRLVSIVPFPETDGQMCQWVPASASTTLAAVLQQQQLSARAATPAADPASSSNHETLWSPTLTARACESGHRGRAKATNNSNSRRNGRLSDGIGSA